MNFLVNFSNLRLACLALLSSIAMMAGVANAAHITGITIDSESATTDFPHQRAEHVIDSTGLDGSKPPQDAGAVNDPDSYFMFWNDGGGDMDNAFIVLNLNGTYDVGSFRFWNMNEPDGRVGRGLRQVNIAFSSTDNTNFGAAQSFFPSIGPAADGYEGELFSLTPAIGATFARLTFGNGSTPVNGGTFNDPGDNFAGFSEIQFYAVPEPATSDPRPVGSVGAGCSRISPQARQIRFC